MKGKRIFAGLLALCMLMFTLPFTTFAAGTGTITINATDTSGDLTGKKFAFYKIFEANASADKKSVAYSWNETLKERYEKYFLDLMNAGKIEGEEGYLETVSAQKAADWLSKSTNLNEFATKLYDELLAEHSDYAETGLTETTGARQMKYTGFDFGYYLVYDTTDISDISDGVKAAIALTNALPSATIKVKADRPNIDKCIVDGTEDKDNASAMIGATVTYKIESRVPLNLDSFTKYDYSISDTVPAGLDLKDSTIKVKAKYKDSAEFVDLLEDTDYALTVNDETISVVFNDMKSKNYDTLQITYDATVNAGAAVANKNTATLTFSNNPIDEESTGTLTDDAVLYTYSIRVTKVSNDTTPKILSGAEFELYQKDASQPIRVVKTEEGTYRVAEPEETDNVVTTVSGVDGVFTIKGLGSGSYYLKELISPDGYKLPDGVIDFTIEESFVSRDIMLDMGEHSDLIMEPGTDNTNGLLSFKVINKKGGMLPETGGMGTTLFTFGGILLMVGALVFFLFKRKGSEA